MIFKTVHVFHDDFSSGKVGPYFPPSFFHCVKSVRIWSFSGPYFPMLGLSTYQKNSEYEQFSRNVNQYDQYTYQKNSEYEHFSRNVNQYDQYSR